MNSTKRTLLLFSGTRNDFNRVIKISGMEWGTDIDLLHVGGINRYGLRDFPQDMIFDLFRRARNIVGCYFCDARELGEHIKENGKYAVLTGRCQYCQMALNLLLAYFIKEKGYNRVIYCSPQFDRRLYQNSAGLFLNDVEFRNWYYPITDYGVVSGEVDQRCICDTIRDMDPDLLMDENSMKEFCKGIIDSGILSRLSMEEAELLPF